MDAALADAICFEASDDMREDPIVLPDVLGYLGMPDSAHWAVLNDLNRLLGIVKLARCPGVEMLEHLGSMLEMLTESFKIKTRLLLKKLRSQIRCVYMSALQA